MVELYSFSPVQIWIIVFGELESNTLVVTHKCLLLYESYGTSDTQSPKILMLKWVVNTVTTIV
jgi:hypothetical protein